MFQGQLFPAYGVSQISIEQIHIDDKVNAIDLVGDCDRPEYRNYIRYRPSIVVMEGPLVGGECAVDGVTPPSNSNDPPPCQGAIDVHFSSMLVTKEASTEEVDFENAQTARVQGSRNADCFRSLDEPSWHQLGQHPD